MPGGSSEIDHEGATAEVIEIEKSGSTPVNANVAGPSVAVTQAAWQGAQFGPLQSCKVVMRDLSRDVFALANAMECL